MQKFTKVTKWERKMKTKKTKKEFKPNFKIAFGPETTPEEDKKILADYLFLLLEWQTGTKLSI